jgi:hypothetical protein
MTDRDVILLLLTLERQAERLTVCHRNPEKFHEGRSDLVAGLRDLRRKVERRD